MTLPLGDFAVVWAFLALNILSPGPNVINTIATSLAGGRLAGFGSALGVGCGVAFWCLGMALGMARLVAFWPDARRWLTFVGVVLLCWFAFRYLRQALAGYRGRRLALPQAPRESFGRAFARSLAVNATNPKALTTWVAILSLFPIARAGVGDVVLLCAGASGIALTIHAGYALLFSAPLAARFYLARGWVVTGLAGVFFLAVAFRLVAQG